MLKFELLKESDIKGENRLSIFKQISPYAIGNEVATNKQNECCNYWLNDFEKGVDKLDIVNVYPVIKAKCVDYLGFVNTSGLNEKNIGIRLKIAFDDIEDELILDCHDKVYSDISNGITVFSALEFPQIYLSDDNPDKEDLDLLYKYGKLRKQDRTFHITENIVTKEIYFYKDRKYVRVDNKWALVSPIEWYYDEKENVLVSKNVITIGIPFARSNGNYMKDFFFETSIINDFIKRFSEEAIMSYEDKYFHDFPINFNYFGYDEELKQLKYWEDYEKKRQKRKCDLEELKNLILTMQSFEELKDFPSKIDEVLKLNEEDEQLVKDIRPKQKAFI